MRANKFDQNPFIRVGDMHDEAVLVASDIEDDSVISDEINGRPELRLHIGRTAPLGLSDLAVPNLQRPLGLRVILPEQFERAAGYDLHGRL